MKTSCFLLATACVLAACSSTNESSNISSTSTNTTGNNVSTTLPANTPTNSQSYGVALGGNVKSFGFYDANNMHKLNIDGQEFNLNEPFGNVINIANYQVRSYSKNIPVGKPLTGTSQAYVINDGNDITTAILYDAAGKSVAVFNGKFTDEKQIPTKGNITYNIKGILTTPNSFHTASGQLNANFDNKTVSGRLNQTSFQATVNGNHFHSAANAATEVSGGFFGNNAAKVAGTLKTGDTAGMFMGKKQ